MRSAAARRATTGCSFLPRCTERAPSHSLTGRVSDGACGASTLGVGAGRSPSTSRRSSGRPVRWSGWTWTRSSSRSRVTSRQQRGLSQVEFQHADVMTWTEPEAFDVVYARALLQHVTDPVDMLSRMWAGVRRGGVLIAEDTDFERAFCEPPNDGFDFFIRNYVGAALQARRRREHWAEAVRGCPQSWRQGCEPLGDPASVQLRRGEGASLVDPGVLLGCDGRRGPGFWGRGSCGLREHVETCRRSGHHPCRPCADPGLGPQGRRQLVRRKTDIRSLIGNVNEPQRHVRKSCSASNPMPWHGDARRSRCFVQPDRAVVDESAAVLSGFSVTLPGRVVSGYPGEDSALYDRDGP